MNKKVTLNSQVTLGYGKANVSFDVKSIDKRVVIAILVFIGLVAVAKALK